MISKKVENALNAQVVAEGYASQLYLSMASWAETQGFSGVAQFLYTHAEEERMHMLKIVKYINERGGHGIVPAVKAPPVKFVSLKTVFESVLEHEEMVSQKINDIVELTQKEKDYSTHNFMQWYVAEQIEEEAMAHTLIDKIKIIGEDKGGLYMFDRDILTLIAAPAPGNNGEAA